VAEGNAGTAALTFAVSLSAANSRTVTVDYQTADGSALAGSDYTAAAGTVTFAPGETGKTVTVAALGDVIDEADETLSVVLSNPTNAVLGAPGTGVGTIVDDDAASLSISGAAVTEGDAGSVNAVFTVSLSTPSSQTVTVQAATADGTATAGTDYTATGPAMLTFAPGQTAQSFAVPVLGDTLDELDEAFAVNLSGASGASIGGAQGIGTIVDDDTSAVSISDATQPEGNTGTSAMVFTVSLAPANDRTVMVQFQTVAGGTAVEGTDYQAVAPTPVTFLAGETSKMVSVPVVGDTVDESDETVSVSLTSPTIAVLGDASGVGTIVDDDTASLAVNDPSVTEGDGGTVSLSFAVTLSGASDHTVTVELQTAAGGTATAGTDYQSVAATPVSFLAGETSKTVAVTVNGDLVDEVDETVFASLANASGAPLGDAAGVGTIVDDDTSNITINDVTVAEGDTGTATATFTVTLSKENSRAVTVDYATANGTATAGSDYVAVAATTLTFAAGETSKTVAVTVNGDTVDEMDETFLVNLTNATNATITDAQGVGTIQGADPVTISINDVTVVEGNGGTTPATFTVSLSNPSSKTITVTWQTANGTATAGSDYVAVAATVLTFAAGETSKTVSVTVNGDTIDEPDETFSVNLTSPTNATIADGQGMGTIQGGDPVTISINDVSVAEGNSGTTLATFTVSLSNASSNNVTVTWQTANGTATAGSDYVAVAATVLTFTPGQTSKTVAVTVNGDTLDEPANETFFVNLTSPTNAVIADAQGVGTITSSADPVTIAINDVSLNEGNAGTSVMSFTVSLSNPSASNVTVTWQTANGTAAAGSDYVAVAATVLTFTAGQTSKTVGVTINGDTTGESNETFTVNLTAPTGATISDAQGIGTIVNDDTPTLVVNDLSTNEGNVAEPVLTVTLSTPPSSTVSVNYTTADGLALAATDYTATSGTLTFNPGETAKTITIALRRDNLPEFPERLFVNFSNPVNALLPDNQAQVTIDDDDQVTWNLYGDANGTSIPGCITLSQVGSGRGAAYNFKTFWLTNKFDMHFRVGLGVYDADGGGGLVFTLRKEGSLILGGGDMGYQSISPSVGVELDTVANWINDPEYDHIAVDENGATCCHNGAFPVQASPTSENIEDGFEHTFRVKRNPTNNQMDVYFDGSLRLSYFKDIVNQLYGGALPTYFGMTGASNCNSSSCPNNVIYFCPVAICIGDSATPHVLVDDIEVSEGNTGNQTATFKVSLYCPRSEVVTVNYATANGTALAGLDYQSAAGTLVFNPGETQKTVAVTVFPDTTTEPDETFTLNLSGPSVNLATPDAQAVAKIIDDVRFGFGQAGDIALWGDWNGDGIDTPGVWRNGTFLLRNSSSAGPADIQFNFGSSPDIPIVGDWNGDGIDTVGIFNGNFFYLKTANTAAASTVNPFYGQPGDRPLAGDWNGDGIDTIGVQRGNTFLLRNSNTAGGADISFSYGVAGDVGVMGDWNGDGIDTPAVFRNGTFFLRNSNTSGGGEVSISYGAFQDRPVAGDLDADGDDNVGFFRNGTFFLRK
jgi:hypothetical protein